VEAFPISFVELLGAITLPHPGPLAHIASAEGELSAYVAPQSGAELVGLTWRRGTQTRELLYRGLDFTPTNSWDGKAPLMWPATGRNYASTLFPSGRQEREITAMGWRYRGKRYPMPIHGFARFLQWRVVASSPSFVRLKLRDTPETRRQFPFGFTLTLEYHLNGNTLTLVHTIRSSAANLAAMPFSIGNHATFNVGRDASVRFASGGEVILNDRGVPVGERGTPGPQLIRLRDLPPTEARPFLGREADRVILDDGLGARITSRQSTDCVAQGRPVRLNLWGDVQAGYFAVEPWLGKQNSLQTGDGLVRLPPGKSCRWTVRFGVASSISSGAPDDNPK